METTTKERDGGDGNAAATGVANSPAVTGRAMPLAMGSVRLGGAGRPVAITTGIGANVEAIEQERLRPRVMIQPHPRSPFGRKLEANVSFSLTTEQVTHSSSRFQVQKTVVGPPERVHSVHHPTRRTPLDAALRHSEAASSTAVQTTTSAHAEASATVIHHSATVADARKRSAPDEVKAAVTRRPKPVLEIRTEHKSEATKRVKHDMGSRPAQGAVQQNLRPVDIAAFVRKPPSDIDQDAYTDGFHHHERLFNEIIAESTLGDDQIKEPISGWRAVDASIDYIYEDPSIDVVQLQLMLHGNRLGGIKRKAVERERLQLAAAEVHKQQHDLTSKMEELQRRKENISKLSEDIRCRNKPTSTSKKVSGSTAKKKTKAEPIPAHLVRKPPVPRLSQLGLKPAGAKKAKKNTESKTGKMTSEHEKTPAVKDDNHDMSDADEGTEPNRHNSSASGSILLGTSSAAQEKSSDSKVPKKRKASKPRAGNTASQPQPTMSSEPPQEQQQRRAVAREYMQLQKQARQLLKAKVEKEKRFEEEHRRLELQRLEQVRLRELEEARKRRIKQKQRDRIHQRKQEKSRLEQAAHSEDPALASPSKSDDMDTRKDPDAENQSFRENAPSRKKRRSGEFEWSGGDRAPSSSSSSPREIDEINEMDEGTDALTDPKLQKLLQLEEKAKMLTSRLQSLANRTRHTGPSSAFSPHPDITSDTIVAHDEEKHSRIDSESDHADSDDADDDDIDDHGSVTRILDESEEEGDDDHSDEDDAADIEVGNRRYSSRRIDEERFALLEREYRHHVIDEADEFDLASIGVQKIQVVWPREDDDEDASDVEPQPSSRFEELSSSSSSSPPASSEYGARLRGQDGQAEIWQSDHSDDGGRHSPKLLEDTVGSYAQRLLEQTARIQQTSTDVEFAADRSPPASNSYNHVSLKTSQWLRDEPSPPSKTRAKPSSDAELLRLIRESDDNLSVINREAKRRFRIQQDQARQRREEQERHQADMVKQRLAANVVDQAVDSHGRRDEETVFEGGGSFHERQRDHPPRIVKLEDVLQAVNEDRAIAESHFTAPTEGGYRGSSESDEYKPPSAPPVVEFWNRQLRAVDASEDSDHTASRQKPATVEIDRTDLHAQRQRQFEVEDEQDADDDEHRRIVSPQTLAKRLLAAVEYHEAISDAHLQLSMMEKAHALEQVQQDTIALAQAFKEEMDSTLLAQQLVDEHAALENKFDEDLQQVIGQLDIVRQAEREDHERELERVKNEAQIARQRETSVQTEPPRLADATTSACFRVEAAVATESERVDFGVQYTEIRAPEGTTFSVVDGFSAVSPSASPLASPSRIENDLGEYTEDYVEETFERASISGPVKVTRMGGDVSIEDAVDSDSNPASANEIESGGSVQFDVESDQAVEMESENEDEQGDIASESAALNYDDYANDKQSQSSVGEENEIESAAESPARGVEISTSMRYDDNDFEDETSLAQSAVRQAAPNSDVVEDDDYEVDSEVGEEDEEETSIVSSDHDDVKSENYSSQSYEDDTEKLVPSVKTVTAASPHTPSRAQIAPTFAVNDFVNPSQFAPTSLPTDVGQAYIAQLENRKSSEEALLAIRLQALHTKLQQDTQPLIEAISAEEHKPAQQRKTDDLRQLVARREALQIAFLSEQANLESQRSACVSRYYQDLLAFQSLGMAAVVTSALLPTNTVAAAIDQRRVTMDQRSEIRQAPVSNRVNDTEAFEKAESSVDAYSEDEFASTTGDVRTSEKNDDDESAEVSDIPDDQSVKSVAEDAGEEEEIQSVVDEHSGDEDEEPESDVQDPSVASEAGDQDYGDEDFASVSESTKTVEKLEASAKEKSVESTPSILVESSSHVESGVAHDDKRDGDSDAGGDYEDGEDEFASLTGSAIEQRQKGSLSEGDVEDETSNARGSVEAEIEDDTGSGGEEQRAVDRSEDAASDAAYSDDNFEASAIAAQEESAVMLVSQSDDSSTTKLLVAEVAELNTKLKAQDEQLIVEHDNKLEKKKLKAQELIQAKEKLIKQQVHLYRQQEERAQVDTIAEMALGLDVHAEVEKAKTTVKEILTSEFEALKQTYPQLVPQQPVKRVDAIEAGSAAPEVQASTVQAKATAITEENSEAQYSEDYDEFEIESFENDGSVASEANLVVSTRASNPIEAKEADTDDDEVSETVNDDVASDIGEENEETSIADESAEMVEASGDELDAYGDEEFDDDAAASSHADEVDASVLMENPDEEYTDEQVSKPGSFINQEAGSQDESQDEGDDQYEDEEFEQNMSRQSSIASGIGENPEKPVASEPHLSKKEPIDQHVADRSGDDLLERMNSELKTAATAIAVNEFEELSASTHAVADALSKPTQLSESLSVSHAEDDLVTASMDEQTKRIEELRRKIETRKQEFEAVQKQLKIEKKKETLREAETELWTEMEQLEAQLVADERILALTRQRGRLESMQLEARHSGLYYYGDTSADLLEGYDLVEEVEAVKPPVIKQDHQAQVRLEVCPVTSTDTRFVKSSSPTLQHDAETEVDFLLAYDYVEAAERPVFTTPTSTDVPDESVTKLVLESSVLGVSESVNVPTSEDMKSATTDAGHLSEIANDSYALPDAAGFAFDLLSQYDFIEAVEAVDAVETVETVEAVAVVEDNDLDLLQDYDHIELAEGIESVEAAAYNMEGVMEESATGRFENQGGGDEEEKSESIRSMDESVDEVLSEEAQLGDVQGDRGDEAVPDAESGGESEDEENVVHEQQSTEVESAEPSKVLNPPRDLEQQAFLSALDTDHDRIGANLAQHEMELTTRVTDMVLARLLQDAIADMHVTTQRAVERMESSADPIAAAAVRGFDDELAAHDSEEEQLSPDVISQDENDDCQTEQLLEEEESLFEGLERGEQTSEMVADRLFNELVTTAVQDGVRLHLKKIAKRSMVHAELPSVESKRQVVEIVTTQITDREVGISIAKQLCLASDGVTLPRLSECMPSHRDYRNASVIYDAVLETACSIHRRLVQDLSFLVEESMDTKQRMIIEQVQQEMEESVWKRQVAAQEAMDRFTRKAQEDEQGELDENDLRLLRAQQRIGSDALAAHFQTSALRKHHADGKATAASANTTPRQRRRLGSSISKSGLASQILQQEADRLADSITERLMSDLLNEELP